MYICTLPQSTTVNSMSNVHFLETKQIILSLHTHNNNYMGVYKYNMGGGWAQITICVQKKVGNHWYSGKKITVCALENTD